jgi:hypothetical protein
MARRVAIANKPRVRGLCSRAFVFGAFWALGDADGDEAALIRRRG